MMGVSRQQGVLGTFNDGRVSGILEKNGAVQRFSRNDALSPDASAAGAPSWILVFADVLCYHCMRLSWAHQGLCRPAQNA